VTSPAQEDIRPPRRPAVARRVAAVGVGVLLLAAAVASSRLGSDARVAARPLPGVPLEGSSGLRLLVASGPAPVVLDVDTEPSRR
jgi:hypothetical protein